MSTIFNIPSVPAPMTCDFGWYFGSLGSPQREPEASFSIGTTQYPPGVTVTAGGSVTLPTNSNITVASTASFEPAGNVMFYAGLLSTQHTMSPYTVVDATHIHCTGGSGTFATGTPVYDPRFYVDQLPLQRTVIFDAIDHNNLGLPTTSVPTGVQAVSYQWDFGNGQISYGPYATTQYPYNIGVSSLVAKLTVLDNLGRQVSCAHRVSFISQRALYGISLHEVQSSAHYR